MTQQPHYLAYILKMKVLVFQCFFNSLQPMEYMQPTRLLHTWNSLGKNIGVSCQFSSPGDVSDLSLLHCRLILYCLSHQGIPIIQKDACMSIFIATLFTIARDMLATDMSIDKWIKKICYIYTIKYYLAIKRNKLSQF